MINSWTQEWNSVNWWTNKTWDPRAFVRKSIGKFFFCIKQIKFVTSTCKVILLFANLVFCWNFLHLSARRRVLFQLTNIAVVKIPFQEAIYAIIIVHRKVELVSLLIVEKNFLSNRFIEEPFARLKLIICRLRLSSVKLHHVTSSVLF